jgi:exonuclease SbcD
MADRPFCFIHASDFHLERPLFGVSEVPDQLREIFLEAPYRAALKLFNGALAENVDFVVLAGDLVHPETAGPRGPLFLIEQFERLAAQHIPVYWATGQVDAQEHWPGGMRLPANVTVFSSARADAFLLQRDGLPLAHIVGMSQSRRRKIRAADFVPAADGMFSIAVAYGEADRQAMTSRGIHYWALGSSHERCNVFSSSQAAHYSGTTQGRQPSEFGAHGATLVAVDAAREIHLQLLPTDVVRWQNQRIVVDATTTRAQLERSLEARLEEIHATDPGIDVLVSWSVSGSGPLLAKLRRGKLAGELLARLRTEHGLRSPGVWSIALTVEPETALPEDWYGQETILGEFLRLVREQQTADKTAASTLNLEGYLNQHQAAGTLAGAVSLDDAETRQRVLRQAAVLGADLLSGEEIQT